MSNDRPRQRGAATCRRLALGTALALAGCGLPSITDVKNDYTRNVRKLGVTPVYPLRETMRIGQLWLTDGSGVNPAANDRPDIPSSMLLSEQLVPAMDEARRARMAQVPRHEKSPADMAAALFGSATGVTFYRQPDKETLELAGLPKYTLSALDQGGLAGAVPQAFASFFAALGFTKSQYLTVEAVGIEMAELPLDTFGNVIARACSGSGGVFGSANREAFAARAFNAAYAQWLGKGLDTRFKPQLVIPRKIYYLRGIRYIYNDSSAVAAALSAAFTNHFPAGVTPPTSPTLPAPAPAGGVAPGGPQAASQAQIDALRQQIADLQKAVTSATGTGIAGSFARATAVGVEMVDLFDRPVAFGFEPIAEEYSLTWRERPDGRGGMLRDPEISAGAIGKFCADFPSVL